MTLTQEYNKNLRIYLRKKSDTSKKSENQRKNKVVNFLKFCESQNIKQIKDINEALYRSFVSQHLNNKSIETKRKYLLALNEFFTRAHLNIKKNKCAKQYQSNKGEEIIKNTQCFEYKR